VCVCVCVCACACVVCVCVWCVCVCEMFAELHGFIQGGGGEGGHLFCSPWKIAKKYYVCKAMIQLLLFPMSKTALSSLKCNSTAVQ